MSALSPCGENCTVALDFYGPAMKCFDQGSRESEGPLDIIYQGAKVPGQNMSIVIEYLEGHNHDIDLSSSLIHKLNCSGFNATYKVIVDYWNSPPTYEHSISDYHNILPSTVYAHDNRSWTSSMPQLNTFMLADVVLGYLNGTFNYSQDFLTAPIHETPLITRSTLDPAGRWLIPLDFETAIPELPANLTLSYIAFGTAKAMSNCTVFQTFQAYKYQPLLLILTYTTTAILTIAAIATGSLALRSNGVASGDVFSQILVTTRNQALDALTSGNSLSGYDARRLKKESIRLGELKVATAEVNSMAAVLGSGHAAFGVRNQTLELRKGYLYDEMYIH